MQLAQNYINVYHQDKGLDETTFSEKRSFFLCHLMLYLNLKENISFKVGGMKKLHFHYI